MRVPLQLLLESCKNHPQTFEQKDIDSLVRAMSLGDGLLSTPTIKARNSGIMQGWVKVIKGMCGGVKYLKRFNLDGTRFHDHVHAACKTYSGTIILLKEYRKIPEVGKALAPNFFADLRFKEFCKPDTHVCKIVNGIDGTHHNEEQKIFDRMLALAKESGVNPRQLDKVFYLAGSGNFYLTNLFLDRSKESRDKRRKSLIQHLQKYKSLKSGK